MFSPNVDEWITCVQLNERVVVELCTVDLSVVTEKGSPITAVTDN